jgi:hypothetical protein
MSLIHIRQIKTYLLTTFHNLIDLSDVSSQQPAEYESVFLTRSLAAFAIMNLANISKEEAAVTVTDGSHDNGIDAVYYHKVEKILFLVQSKWKHDGNGSVERGDIQKFITGFRDVVSERFDRFNQKLNAKATEIDQALSDARTKILIVLIYSGKDPLSEEGKRDFRDLLSEMNDPTEVVSLKPLRQMNIYNAIAQGAKAAPINIEVALYEWGKTSEPYQAYYGQVSASDVAVWWEQYYPSIFTPNIRMFLGETDINEGILETLKVEPEKFWYFNNGITALCSTIKKKPLGGSGRETGFFECKDVRIVNGAQTVGSIATAASSFPDKIALAKVPIRFISLEQCPEGFDRDVTRYNNTQNRIDRRDLVALDIEQERIRSELQLEAVTYVYKSGETIASGDRGFELAEATVASACKQTDISYSVQAKREIGKLWEDINKPPYKVLFNPSVSGPSLWKLVQILRAIEDELKEEREKRFGRERLFTIHGNRFIAYEVYRMLPENLITNLSELSIEQIRVIKSSVITALNKVIEITNRLFPDSYPANLFKNLKKCRDIAADF